MRERSVYIRKVLNGYVVEYEAGESGEFTDKDEVTAIYSSFESLLKAIRNHFNERELMHVVF